MLLVMSAMLAMVWGVMGVSAQPTAGEPFFVTAEVVPPGALVGQQMTYVVTAYSDTLRDVTLTPPVFAQMVQGGLRSVGSSVTVGGKQYNLVTFAVTIYPSRDGILTIPPAEVVFEGTVLTAPETLQTDAVRFRADAPPDTPDGFSGLVGRHEVAFNVDMATAELGQPITAEYRIRGTGEVAGLPAPTLLLPDGWRAYLDPAQTTSESDGTVTISEKVFRWRVMPDRAGALSLGVAPLTVYDVPTAAFTDLTVDPIAVQVLPGANGETVRASAQAALEQSGLGLPDATDSGAGSPPILIGWVAPLGGALAIGIQAAYRRLRAAQREARRVNALATAKTRLSAAAKLKGEATLKAIEAAAAGYLRDKETNVTPALREALIVVESVRYAPQIDDVAGLASAVYAALSQSEGEAES